jgi:acetyl-CoA C-acetyltransferase
MADKNDIVIVDAVRTAVGNFSGSLSTLSADKLGAEVIKALLARTKIAASDVSELIMGQVLTAATGQNPARQAAIHAGLSQESTAMTINQVCGSGLRAVAEGMKSIRAGDSTIVIAGGQESMSLAPHAMQLRTGVKMGNGAMIDTMITDGLWDAFNNYHMGITAENVAQAFQITREEQDRFAANSQAKAAKALAEGYWLLIHCRNVAWVEGASSTVGVSGLEKSHGVARRMRASTSFAASCAMAVVKMPPMQ